MRTVESLNVRETLDLISKQWANTKDIGKLACVGLNKANEIKNEIKMDLISQGYRLPTGVVPMEKVVEYLKININYLKKIKQ